MYCNLIYTKLLNIFSYSLVHKYTVLGSLKCYAEGCWKLKRCCMQTVRSRSLSDRSFVAQSRKPRSAAVRVDISSWRKPLPTRSICLRDDLQPRVVTLSPPKPSLFLDELSLPYADESLTTTPVDQPPSTSGCHISVFGHSDCSIDDAQSTDTSSGAVATPTSDVTSPHSSPSDDESRDRCDSIIMTMTSLPPGAAAARGSLDNSSTVGPSVPVYRPPPIVETFRRCEPTHFHWTSTSTSASARPRPSLRLPRRPHQRDQDLRCVLR